MKWKTDRALVGAGTGAASGALAGSAVPGIGTAIGAIVGGLGGLLGGFGPDDPEAPPEERWKPQFATPITNTDWAKDATQARPVDGAAPPMGRLETVAALEDLRKKQRQPYFDPRAQPR